MLLCLLPILFLLATTLLPPLLLPSARSLPLSAILLALVRLAYLSSPPLLVLAHSVVGALEGLVPLAVIFGAVLLFEVMAATGCLQFLMANVRCLSAGSPIAEVFLIGWAFAYTISGGWAMDCHYIYVQCATLAVVGNCRTPGLQPCLPGRL